MITPGSYRVPVGAAFRWLLVAVALALVAFLTMGAVVNQTSSVSTATGVATVVTGTLGALILWLRRRALQGLTRWFAGLAVASATLGTLAAGSWVVWYLQHPHLIAYDDALCQQMRTAHAEAGTGEDVQCRYTAHLFPAAGGAGWFAVGTSANMRGECRFLANGVIDPRRLETDLEGPMMAELPQSCRDELADIVKQVEPLTW